MGIQDKNVREITSPDFHGGILPVATRTQVLKMQEEEDAQRAFKQDSPMVANIVSYLIGIWTRNKEHKDEEHIQDQMILNLAARNSEYTSEKSAAISAQGGSNVFMGITNMKCAHAEAWILDVLSSKDKSWALEPTPNPDPSAPMREKLAEIIEEQIREQLQPGQRPNPEQLTQIARTLQPVAEEAAELEAKTRAKAMETEIFDQMVEGGWDEAFEDFVADVVTLKAGFLKGPIVRRSKRIEWVRNQDNQVVKQIVEVIRPEYERVSPFDMYPSPEQTEIHDGDLVQKDLLSRADLVALKEEKGYRSEAIDEVLEKFNMLSSNDLWGQQDQERADLEDKEDRSIQFRSDIEALEFWVNMQGKQLIEMDIKDDLEGNPLTALDEYQVNAIVVNSVLIFINVMDIGEPRPYSKAGWRKIPGSFWYKGVPELMEDLQSICNAAVRALVNNMGIASGPQVEVDTDRLVPGEDLESIFPFKIWQTTGTRNQASPAIRFFNAQSNAAELISVYDRFSQQADDHTGIPAFAFGNDRVAGAGRTSSGLSMLMSSAARGLKKVILDLDTRIFKTVVKRQYDWNMEFSEKDDIKGDIQIRTTGAVAIMVREQMAERRMNFLNSINNDLDNELIGMEGRATVLREVAASLESDEKKIVKTPEEVRELEKSKQEAEAAAQEQEQQLQAQLAQIELQKAQIELQKEQMELQATQVEMQVKLAQIDLEREKLGIQRGKVQIDAQSVSQEGQIKVAKLQAEGEKNRQDALIRGRDVDIRAAAGVAKAAETGLAALTGARETPNLLAQSLEEAEAEAELQEQGETVESR